MFELHHIGYLVGDLSAAADRFAARFGYIIESGAIEDSMQTANVQFLRQPGAVHWLELITPSGTQSKLHRALQKGEGLHHLCYEVSNLEQAATKLREDNMLPLGKPRPAVAFSGRLIAWYMDRSEMLIELVQAGAGDFSLGTLKQSVAGGQ